MADVAGNDGQCCPCGELVGCQCAGEACGLECRKKEGTAELCGYPEFTSPSTPPKAYKRRTTSGAMTSSRYGDAACEGEVTVAAALECRSKTVTAELCGHSEYMTPSTPPKKYRRQDFAGSILDCSHETSDCSGFHPHPSLSPAGISCSGSYRYGQNDCAVTNTQTVDKYEDPSLHTCVMPAIITNSVLVGALPASIQAASGYLWNFNAVSPLQRVANGGGCFEFFGWRSSVGTVTFQLSEEDTEEDAVARANVPAEWTGGGSCATHTSYRSVRTTGFTFNSRTAQTRLVVSSGLVAGVNYEGRVYLYRRAVGTSDPFVNSGETIPVFFEAAGIGYTSDWLDIPQVAGWEYRAESAEVFGAIEELIVDTWDIVEDFAPGLPAACVPAETNDSVRTVDGTPTEPGPFASTPPDVYGLAADVVTDPDERTTTGNDECQADGEGFRQVTGEVVEALSEEDTEEDALDRAVDALSWATCASGCLVDCSAFITERTSGFEFAFSMMQTRVSWTAIIGHSYNVKVRFARRLLGSTGPFLFHSLHEQTISADVILEQTDWIDVPNEAGWETVAANCSVMDVT